jgi:hypothetical protein
MTPCNKEAMEDPRQMTYEPTMTRELNGWNLIHILPVIVIM